MTAWTRSRLHQAMVAPVPFDTPGGRNQADGRRAPGKIPGPNGGFPARSLLRRSGMPDGQVSSVAQQLPMQAAPFMIRRRLLPRFAPICLGIGVVLASVRAHADERATTTTPTPFDAPQPARAMTIAEALAYAHDHQPAIRAGVSRVAAKMAQATIPSGQWLPTVALTAQLYGMTTNNTTGTYLGTEFMDVPRSGGTPSVSQS